MLHGNVIFLKHFSFIGGPFYAHTDHVLHYMPETVEHRALRTRHLRGGSDQVDNNYIEIWHIFIL